MRKTTITLLVAAAFAPAARANPAGAQVASGAALLSNPNASTLQIVNTPGTILNWQSFSIANGETTRFVQSNAASAVLNRVAGMSPSSILGRLESNGRVFLINPNGVVFGGSAVVDVAGLIASTRDITNANFLAANYLFSGAGNGTITLQAGAQILTSNYGPGGQVWLLAKNVTQEAGATITAPQGQVVLAAGSQIQVGTNGLGQMSFAVTTDGTNTVDSLGTIAADRGAVGLFADFINHRGTINAGTGGQIEMNATRDLKLLGASTTTAPAGTIALRGGSLLEVEHDSTVTADGAGGKLSFESNDIRVYPSFNTHAAGGEVVFNQYGPSQYVGSGWTTVSDYDGTNDPLLVFPKPGEGFVVRVVQLPNTGPGGFRFVDVELDTNGTFVSSTGSFTGASRPGVFYYTYSEGVVEFFRTYPFTGIADGTTAGPRVPLAGGGWIQSGATAIAYRVGEAAPLKIFGPDGTLLATREYGGTHIGQGVPLSDGTILFRNGSVNELGYTLAGPSANVLTRNGTDTGRSVYVGAHEQTPAAPPLLFPTADGGFSAVRGDYAGSNERVQTQHWTKTGAPYAPTNAIAGAAGAVASLATAPGRLPEVVAPVATVGQVPATSSPSSTTPTPPPVVSGTGSGARLDQELGGCNAALCPGLLAAALAELDALRMVRPPERDIGQMSAGELIGSLLASERAGRGDRIDDQTAAIAVLELSRAAGHGGEVSSDTALSLGFAMQDNGELRQLIIGYGYLGAMSPEGRFDTLRRWIADLKNEQLSGLTGQERTAGQISVRDVVSNMTTADELNIFMDTVVNFIRR